ncbi:MAG TPA: glycosyltransferase family 39 protein [Isosphaeraceae bacterium]|jgi:hypothetical protein|nr:glycosyltransferase family 39 protein [Isosphaeraceae bacterium]
MACRRGLGGVIVLATALHAWGMARATLPAQDGLIFIRVARAFHQRPWADVVRGTDRHPLYPALVALARPIVANFERRGPESWWLAAQGVSALAAIALLIPLHGLVRRLFDARTATLATLLFVLLPLPARVGHDTLADSVALLCSLGALRLGVAALDGRGWSASVASGLVAGLGFLARPEVALIPVAVLITATISSRRVGGAHPTKGLGARWAPLGLAFLAMVGSYAIVKGEVSEKLALRIATSQSPSAKAAPKAVGHGLPKGLDDPRWDFSAKEESGHVPTRGWLDAARRLATKWVEWMAWAFAVLALWGAIRARAVAGPAKRLVVVFLVVDAVALARHAATLGYLSGRHVLPIVLLSVPWSAAALVLIGRRLSALMGWNGATARALGASFLVALLGLGIALQARGSSHESRACHSEAGRWLLDHAKYGDAVLDTRGWAAFVSGLNAYDYWHVRQALTDARLAFVVVGDDELAAPSRRGETLRAILGFAAEPVARFPGPREGSGVRVFRFRRPASWEGLTR